MPLAITTTSTGTVTWTLAIGESVQSQVTIQNNGVAVNLTGYEIKMYIDFPSPLTISTTNGGITIVNAASGICQVNISDTTSADFTAGSYLYEFWTLSPAPVVSQRLFYGQFVVLNAVTPIP